MSIADFLFDTLILLFGMLYEQYSENILGLEGIIVLFFVVFLLLVLIRNIHKLIIKNKARGF